MALSRKKFPIEYIRLANEICRLIKHVGRLDSKSCSNKFWKETEEIISSIYSAGLKLNSFPRESVENAKIIEMGNHFKNSKHLERLCEEIGNYRIVFNPLIDADVISTSAHEDLLSIISDLFPPYTLWKKNGLKHRRLAIMLWRRNLENHTSWHMLSLMRALYFYTAPSGRARV